MFPSTDDCALRVVCLSTKNNNPRNVTGKCEHLDYSKFTHQKYYLPNKRLTCLHIYDTDSNNNTTRWMSLCELYTYKYKLSVNKMTTLCICNPAGFMLIL